MTKNVQMETSAGTVRIELDDEKAPLSVANFLAYAKSGHFDGTVFHRVIKGFMLQGGGFEPGMRVPATRTRPRHSSSSIAPTTTSWTSAPRTRRAGAMRCSAASWKAWTWWTASRRPRLAAKASTTTCHSRT